MVVNLSFPIRFLSALHEKQCDLFWFFIFQMLHNMLVNRHIHISFIWYSLLVIGHIIRLNCGYIWYTRIYHNMKSHTICHHPNGPEYLKFIYMNAHSWPRLCATTQSCRRLACSPTVVREMLDGMLIALVYDNRPIRTIHTEGNRMHIKMISLTGRSWDNEDISVPYTATIRV